MMNSLQASISPLFKGINNEELSTMLACIHSYTRSYPKGSFVLFTDEPVPCVGVVLEGCIQLIKEDIWGNKVILVASHSGELFGETFVCSSAKSSSVSFYAPQDTNVLFLPFERVIHTCDHSCKFHHCLVENMMILVAHKNEQLMEKLEIIGKKTLREKILTYLSIQAQRSGRNYFEVPMGRVELADYLCADRSALTRELSTMKQKGMIDYDKNTFHLLK